VFSDVHTRNTKRSAIAGVFSIGAFIFVALLVTGVDLRTAFLLISILLIQIVTGSVIWALLRHGSHVSPLELFGMGFVIGSLLSLLSSQVLIRTPMSGISWLLPSLLLVLALSLLRQRMRFASIAAPQRREIAGMSLSVLLGLIFLLPSVLAIRIEAGFPYGRYAGDLIFFENLAQGISRFGPTDNILLADEAVRYHWFVYAWQGALSNAAGAEPFIVLTRALPLALLVAVAALAVAWAASLSTVKWVPTLAGLLVTVGGFVGAQQGVVLNFDSPSNAYASALLLAFAIGLTPLLHMPSSSFWPSALVLTVIAGSTVGSKASHAAVLAAGLVLLSVVALRYEQKTRFRIWLLTLASGVAMAVVYWWTILGLVPGNNQLSLGDAGIRASTFQGLDPFPTTLGTWLGTAVLILAILPRWMGLGWLVWNPVTRYEPTTVLGVGIGIGGLFAVTFTSSGGTNEVWFAVAATSVIGVLSAVGIGSALRDVTLRELVPAIVFAGITTIAVFVAYALAVTSGASVLWRGPVLAWILAGLFGGAIATYRAFRQGPATNWFAWTTLILLLVGIGARAGGTSLWQILAPPIQASLASEMTLKNDRDVTLIANTWPVGASEFHNPLQWNVAYQPAAEWLAATAEPSDIIATTNPYSEAVLSATTGLRMYVAGIPYVNGYTNQQGFTAFERRLANIEQLVSQPSEEVASELRNERVRFLWIDTLTTPTEGTDQLGQVVFADDAVIIVDLSASNSNSS
jgi:hypothetical protein